MSGHNSAPATMFQNAEAYERLMGRWSRRLAPQLIHFGGLHDGDRVLDVGCGTASLSFVLPEFANVSAVVGVDLAEGYVEFARTRNQDSRFTFQQADACNLAFEDSSSSASGAEPRTWARMSATPHKRTCAAELGDVG